MSQNEEDKELSDEQSAESEAIVVAKKKKKRADGEGSAPSRDRNKRVREQAAKKMEQAKESAKSRANRIGATGLDAGEMVDDAMARGFAAFTKWIKTNRRTVEFSAIGLILAGAGYAAWDWYSNKSREEASAALMLATANAAGVVEEKKDDKEKPAADSADNKRVDSRPHFDSYQALQDEALRTYRVAADGNSRSGAGILARLGEAGVLLERHDFDGAIQAVNAVLATDLAKADESVRMAAHERLGMALEGKGDEAGALAAYATLADSNLDIYKNYGLYHQARLSYEKGKKDEAKDKLHKLKERLKGVDNKNPAGNRYLLAQVDALLRSVDPTAESLTPPAPGGELTPEQLIQLQKELEKMRQNPPDLEENAPTEPSSDTPAASGSAPPPPAASAPAPAASAPTPASSGGN
ncbi:MAG TPA: hypothetical protein PLJ27_09445 [Polyangiaceae bacterium]|nr:MAG: hypothetical protein BWY17_01786 [Deltaproteobacteria bacterium ADurb.Bin207]HNS99807.1 hypothetical protein [Polyangiaceae bacterium]HNZ23231.1 hypothetical protein [Polyangiaceae bacterium]HOD24662.1 hypothetical protein [Polyangiaceae bacterium]HOE50929.1 hypothetical protein [Polyangiaceae bacterium]